MDSFDMVIVGGGVAGWTAARRAQELGSTVVVLERFHAAPGFGNGRLSGGWFHAAMMSPRAEPDDLYANIMAKSEGHARPELARAWAQNVARSLSFLTAQGGVFEKVDLDDDSRRRYPDAMTQNVLTPTRLPTLGRQFFNAGPDRLLRAMHRQFVSSGGTFLPAHRAIRLERKESRVVGVWADGPQGRVLVPGLAVLLADGGFQGNASLVRKYITSAYKLRGSTADVGDALLMGLEVGALAVNMNWFYGYPLHRDSLFDDSLWPSPSLGRLIEHGIVVDGSGRRFADEGIREEEMADAIAKSTSPGSCWVIFDHASWEGVACTGGALAPNPILSSVGATIEVASTIVDLARQTQLPRDELTTAVRATNAWAHEGRFLSPFRSGYRATVEIGPFYAVPLIAGITFAMGGLLVNEHAQVMDSEEKSIGGLYAAGGAMGGLQGGPGSRGYTGGWSEASTFGLLAADHVVALNGQR
jgi:fumarate reductase flavoprotein subunit